MLDLLQTDIISPCVFHRGLFFYVKNGIFKLIKNCALNYFNTNQIKSFSYRNSISLTYSNCVYFVDTRFSEVTMILPPNPEQGDYITFIDYNNTWNLNNLTILNNSKKIKEKLEDLIVNVNSIMLTLLYYGDESDIGWNVIIYANI